MKVDLLIFKNNEGTPFSTFFKTKFLKAIGDFFIQNDMGEGIHFSCLIF